MSNTTPPLRAVIKGQNIHRGQNRLLYQAVTKRFVYLQCPNLQPNKRQVKQQILQTNWYNLRSVLIKKGKFMITHPPQYGPV